MRFRKIKEEDPTIMIVPFIDMVLALLLFMVITSHIDIASGVSIQIPKIAGKSSEEGKEKVILIIDRTGQLFLKGGKQDIQSLGKSLRNMVKEKGVIHLVLQADKEVPHGVVVEAMDVAKTAGVQSIIIAAQWKAQKLL